MKLAKLLERCTYDILQGQNDIEITKLTNRSEENCEGSVFVCIKGMRADGHEFVQEAVMKGACAVIVEHAVKVPSHVAVICVENTRYALALMAAAYYDFPAEKLKIIGVTGTKGKTTTTYMVKAILEEVGYKVGLIGTNAVMIGTEVLRATNTTPESLEMQRYFRQMSDAGCDVVVMEVSSQGLMLHRTAGISFEIGVFTNLGKDHIGPGEHRDFEEYKRYKGMLFRQCKIGIANVDDKYFEDIFENATCETVTYGFSPKADIRAKNRQMLSEPGRLGVEYQVTGLVNYDVEVGIPGIFSVYNSLAAIAVCKHFSLPNEKVQAALKRVKVKGRVELLDVSNAYTVLIDYAHNAMSLENLLTTLREYRPRRLVCLFGCGGNRSKSRRYEMGEVAGKMADLTILTSDNPRFEKPQEIIDDIKVGMRKTAGNYVEILDRREAIYYALAHAERGDVIVLAGKGHEDYQEIQGVKYDMDERLIVADYKRQGAACTQK